MIDTTPFFTDDTIVFGLLMAAIALIFYTESRPTGFWHKFYKIVPGLFMAYMIPALFTTLGWIAPDWESITPTGETTQHSSSLYYVASRYLLPAALVLMTLSIDLKAVMNLGWKALIMFFTGTLGIIIGGPIAIYLIALVSPETVGGIGADAVWRGLSTLAGSWIGGGANQTAMHEIYGYNQEYDVIIISKDGTLGEIYYVNGIYIGLPEAPKDRKKILNWELTSTNQKFRHIPLPNGLNEKTQYQEQYKEYIKSIKKPKQLEYIEKYKTMKKNVKLPNMFLFSRNL